MALCSRLLEFGNAVGLIPRNTAEAQEPAHRSSHRSDDVTADAARQVSVVATRIDGEQLLRPGGCLLGVMKRRQISLSMSAAKSERKPEANVIARKRIAVNEGRGLAWTSPDLPHG